ncbi:MFS transporter [Cohnella xylanilytica]|uniref:MFS transporter n=1 Tax=Cohnella xylanilytica TaxID=557555 RepID=A0A841U599_9BACL|nr:MFS transporter [Cohnella xylanilytica]MBB6693194.1 MFS transporter [Cohnella xylanilytica]
MSAEIRKLLVMNAITSVVTVYIGIFVNLYIWQENQRIADVSLYNMAMFVSWGAAFAAAAKLLTRFSIRLPLCLSALCGGAAFFYLMTSHLDNRTLWIVLLGLPVGAMFGLAQAAQNLGVALQGRGSEFAPYFAAVHIIVQVVSIAVPIASAKVIDGFGYGGSFALMLAFLALMLVVSARMPRIRLRKPEDPAEARRFGQFGARLAFGRPGARWIVLSLMAAGVFMQFQNLFALLFTFSVTQNKLLIALLNVAYTLSSLLGLWLYRRFRSGEMRWLWLGNGLLAAGFLIALLQEPAALIVSNVLTTIGMFYFSTVWNAQQFRYIEFAGAASQASFLVWRECILIATRCALLAMTMSLTRLQGVGFVTIVGITIACMLVIPLVQSKAMRALQGSYPVQASPEAPSPVGS